MTWRPIREAVCDACSCSWPEGDLETWFVGQVQYGGGEFEWHACCREHTQLALQEALGRFMAGDDLHLDEREDDETTTTEDVAEAIRPFRVVEPLHVDCPVCGATKYLACRDQLGHPLVTHGGRVNKAEQATQALKRRVGR